MPKKVNSFESKENGKKLHDSNGTTTNVEITGNELTAGDGVLAWYGTWVQGGQNIKWTGTLVGGVNGKFTSLLTCSNPWRKDSDSTAPTPGGGGGDVGGGGPDDVTVTVGGSPDFPVPNTSVSVGP
jgi:hypothetical protein